jgi:hypothetical protein
MAAMFAAGLAAKQVGGKHLAPQLLIVPSERFGADVKHRPAPGPSKRR